MKSRLLSALLFVAGSSAASALSPDEIADLKYAANKGEVPAIIRMAECYERGDGVPADKMTALAYYLLAFKQDAKNEKLKNRIAELGGERFLPGGSGVSGKSFVADLGGGVKMELLSIPAGTFTMGSPESEEGRFYDESQVRVRITKPFYLGKTEVTQAQWKAVMGNNPSYFKGDNLPVEKVSWEDAMAFCRKLTERERKKGLPAEYTFTLPTEAQWEYACRAGTTTRFCSGDSESALSKVAWRDGNSGKKTHPVGTKSPNAWGLYDMHGNVWEWCSDWYAESLLGGNDPAGAKSGSRRVFRGGSWCNSARDCRSALRNGISPGNRINSLGFRVALVRE